jgi:hypothetical protein
MNEDKAGIHFAIRNKLVDFIKKNPKASYDEAKEYISKEVKGWDLSKDDFEESKSL